MARGADWQLWMRILEGEGDRSFAYVPVPTALHFLARWREDRESWPRKLLRRVREWERPTPPELQLTVPGGCPEQRAAWEAMSPAPARWARDLRRAVQVEMDLPGTYNLPLSGVLELATQTARRVMRRRAAR
jgi:hypothetical protein